MRNLPSTAYEGTNQAIPGQRSANHVWGMRVRRNPFQGQRPRFLSERESFPCLHSRGKPLGVPCFIYLRTYAYLSANIFGHKHICKYEYIYIYMMYYIHTHIHICICICIDISFVCAKGSSQKRWELNMLSPALTGFRMRPQLSRTSFSHHSPRKKKKKKKKKRRCKATAAKGAARCCRESRSQTFRASAVRPGSRGKSESRFRGPWPVQAEARQRVGSKAYRGELGPKDNSTRPVIG